MKYDAVRHALTRDDGELVATLSHRVSTVEGFELADVVTAGWGAAEEIEDLRIEVGGLENDYGDAVDRADSLESELVEAQEVITSQRKKMRDLEAECERLRALAFPEGPIAMSRAAGL